MSNPGITGKVYRDPTGQHCEEASVLIRHTYAPCGSSASTNLYSKRDDTTYLMCDMCVNHNMHRGMVRVDKEPDHE